MATYREQSTTKRPPVTRRSSIRGRDAKVVAIALLLSGSVVMVLTAAGGTAPALSVSDSPIIQASGTQLYLYGAPYRFVGVNAYEAATDWGTNAGCGADLSDGQLDQLFASLPANSLVRFWAFQGTMATNVNTHQLDWGPLDRVFAAAAAHGQRLIVTLTDQGGTCDGGHWQDPSWYQSGFKTVFNDPATTDGRGLTPLS